MPSDKQNKLKRLKLLVDSTTPSGIFKNLESLQANDQKLAEEINNLTSIIGDNAQNTLEEIKINIDNLETKLNNIKLIPGPQGNPGKNYILTEIDKQEISRKIKVPIVEKVIERIEKQPMITEKIKEVALTDTPEQVRDKLQTLKDEERLDKSAIKGLEELTRSRVIGGLQGLFTYVDESKKGLLKAINFNPGTNMSITHSVVNGLDTLTFTGANQTTSPAGNDTEVQFNDGGVFGADPSFTWIKTTNVLNVKDAAAAKSITLSHDGTDGLLQTTSGNLLFKPAGTASVFYSQVKPDGDGTRYLGDGDARWSITWTKFLVVNWPEANLDYPETSAPASLALFTDGGTAPANFVVPIQIQLTSSAAKSTGLYVEMLGDNQRGITIDVSSSANTLGNAHGLYLVDDLAGSTTTTYIRADTAASTVFQLSNDGQVFCTKLGVQTTSPDSLAEVSNAGATSTQPLLTISNETATSTLDPTISFRTGATPAQRWIIGCDDSDSDVFKFTSGTGALGGNSRFTIRTSDVVIPGNNFAAYWGDPAGSNGYILFTGTNLRINPSNSSPGTLQIGDGSTVWTIGPGTNTSNPGSNFAIAGGDSGSGSNLAGGVLTVRGGNAKGNGASSIVFQAVRANQGSGSTSRTATTMLTIGNTAYLTIAAGATTAGSTPLVFTSGSLNTTAIAGAMEFLTDDFYLTITTGAARKGIVLTDGANLTSGTIPVATTNGRLIDSSLTSTNLTSGTYSPSVTNSTNTDSAVTATQAQYLRIGNVITVSGRFTADPTLAATATSFELSLPVAASFAAAEDCAGTAFCGAIAGQGAEVIALVANNTAKVQWISGDITSQTWSYTFTYEI